MQRFSHQTSGNWPRRLRIESLETRQLLAGDLCELPNLAATASSFSVESEYQAASVVQANDAGGSRDSAARLGNLDGTRRLNGSLNWFDRVDAFHFTLESAASVELVLSGLNQDADLALFDAAGRPIAVSANYGRANESLAANLAAGEYYVSVNSATFSSVRYQLSLTGNLVPSTPGTQPEGSGDASPSVPNNTSPSIGSPGAGSGNVAPLADVAFFGSSRDWSLNQLGAPEAWAAGYAGQGVTVAVVDSGVDLTHPELVHSIFVNPGEIPGNGLDDDQNGFVDDVHGYDFVSNDSNPSDGNGHGTHVAGTIAAANNGLGATGVAPQAKILPIRVLDNRGSGNSNSVAAGIRYAARMGADIINLSLGGSYSSAIEAAIDYAHSLGSLVIAAAGNESAALPGFPARFSATKENVLSVGATTSASALSNFSNRVGSSGAQQVDAPGSGIYSTWLGGGYATLSGTSMAAPHVAGLAALALSANSTLTPAQLRSLITGGVTSRANGSDSLGSASAVTTVAYAAAGLTQVSSSVGTQSFNQQTNSSNLVWATLIADATPGQDLAYKHRARSTMNESITLVSQATLMDASTPRIFAASQAPNTLHSTLLERDVDDLFAMISPNEDDSELTNPWELSISPGDLTA